MPKEALTEDLLVPVPQKKRNGEVTLAIIQSTVKVGQKPSKEEMKWIKAELKNAAKHPLNLEACPELPPEALQEFAQLAVERNRQKKKRMVTIRIASPILENYKTMGKGYTSIMADILGYAVRNPEFLKQAIR
jgi:uncharacterized protein (DUF4415 family)